MARSILKDNTAPLPSTTSRRVSFAPEVTLHQIEVRNPNKRRKTDGGASGYVSLSSESDFEVVHYSSQQELMKDKDDEEQDSRKYNDHLMSLSPVSFRSKKKNDGEDVNVDGFDDSPDDGGKPLTDSSDEEMENDQDGSNQERSGLPAANKHTIDLIRNLDGGKGEDTEVSMELTGGKGVNEPVSGKKETNNDGGGGATTLVDATPLVYASDEDADYSSNDDEEEEAPNSVNTEDHDREGKEEEEEDMQLTGRIEKPHAAQLDESEDMQLTGPVNTTSRQYRQPTANSDDDDDADADDNDDDTINLTRLMSKVDKARNMDQTGSDHDVEQNGKEVGVLDEGQNADNEVDDGSNMELTERVSRVVVPQLPILKPNLEALSDAEDEEEEEEEAVSNGHSNAKDHSDVKVQEPVDMELTEPVNNDALIGNQDKSVVEMEFTQPIRKEIAEHQDGVDDLTSQTQQDMELTEPVGGAISHPSTSGEQEEAVDDVTQGQSVISMDVTERQQPLTDSQKSMELTQSMTVVTRHDGESSSSAKEVVSDSSSMHPEGGNKEEEKRHSSSPDEDRFANYKQVPLSQFLDDVHLKFYTDIDSITSTSIGLDSNEATTHQPPSIHELIMAIPYKEMHALNNFIVNELQNYIRDGEQVFQDFSSQIGNDNLPIMKEFYTTNDTKERDVMSVSLNNIKVLAKLESKSTWFKWRSTLTQNVIEEMDKQIELLEKSRMDLDEDIQRLSEQSDLANDYRRELVDKLQRLHDAKRTMGSLSQDQVNDMRIAFSQSKTELRGLAEKVEQAKDKLHQSEQTLVELMEQKRDLVKRVNDVEFELEKRRTYTTEERNEIKRKYENFSESTRLKYIRTEDTSNMVFVYDDMISIKIDFIKQSFQIGKVQSNKFHFKSLIDYVYKFPVSNKNVLAEWNNFKSYWQKLVQFDTVLDFIKFQWPIKLIENDTGGAGDAGDVIKFQFDYFDFTKQRRYIVDASLEIESLLDFERKLSFTVKPARKFHPNEVEVDETLVQLGKGIDLPQCTYTFVPNI
ncbi:hypothetical protein I9W82_001789 [Candida metapsilosis]|uniref:Spc7 kinetochore protein domain-containing protein n=1 Tax=Candida metapsilosis TaxID=273372 RepID=A0A8H7ZGX4_9ASCO|nr:hypothetical protein I9W82_001789 [Candida metapsilosis]